MYTFTFYPTWTHLLSTQDGHIYLLPKMDTFTYHPRWPQLLTTQDQLVYVLFALDSVTWTQECNTGRGKIIWCKLVQVTAWLNTASVATQLLLCYIYFPTVELDYYSFKCISLQWDNTSMSGSNFCKIILIYYISQSH